MDGQRSQVYWAGLDVSAEKFDAAVCYFPPDLSAWMGLRTRSFALTPAGVRSFIDWIARYEGGCEGLCAEHTGIYSARLQKMLEFEGTLPRLSLVNPRRIKGAARMLDAPGKSDVIDARVIAVYAATNRPAPKAAPSEAHRRLREALKLRDAFLKQEKALNNMLISLDNREAKASIRVVIRSIQRQFEHAEERIRAIIDGDPQFRADWRLLQTIPTVGPQVATAILSVYGDLRTWRRGEVLAIAGLAPHPRESGKSVRGRPHISKRGGGMLRAKQYLGSTYLLTHDCGFNREIMRRFAAGEPGKVCIVALMSKVLLIARAIVKSGHPFDKERWQTA